MKLTQEQIDIINSTGNIKINAVAGSGKTSTIIEYAKTRSKNSRILYLAFNKTVKLEAINKFKSIKVYNVVVDTIHALAYKNIVIKNKYRLKENSYNTEEIVELLKLENEFQNYEKYIFANHINKFFSYFCNNDKEKIYDLNYLDVVTDDEAIDFVKKQYKLIEDGVISLYTKMKNMEIDITHDFYLKEYQLSNPELNYNYIIFDEGQDASPVIIDIFMKQKGIKVIVGDTHQQIYSWRYAVNALEKINYKNYYLSTSFRFGSEIAELASAILKWKNYIDDKKFIRINGYGKSRELKTKAILARTNLHLLVQAIEYVSQIGKIKLIYNFIKKLLFQKETRNIYFEGNINSCIYLLDGISIYDVLNLFKGKNQHISNKIIKKMKNVSDLLDYAKKTENKELPLIIDIIKK